MSLFHTSYEFDSKGVTMIKPDGKSSQPLKNKAFRVVVIFNHKRYRDL